MNIDITACPLDCFDACSITYKDGKLSGTRGGHTEGFLCPHLNHYEKHERIISPSYKGVEISLDEALVKLKELLLKSSKSETLFYKGSGNFGLMQDVTGHFFSSYGATLTEGTLCDGAGEAGVIKGRGSNKNMPLQEIKKSEVVIIWGRNPHTTSSHLLPTLKNKTLIVIDPIKTKIAKKADIHIQIKPTSDIYLAILLAYMLDENGLKNESYLNSFTSDYEEYFNTISQIDKELYCQNIGVSPEKIEKIIELIKGKKLAIVCGIGFQKYKNGADVMQAIDSIAVTLGLFSKEGCGVSYLGDSRENILSPFNSKTKKVSKVNTDFSSFTTVFVQGSNPLSQMPDSLRVGVSMGCVENLIYFGLYENETSSRADLVIPAKIFLEKDDIRTSYSHNAFMPMNKQIDSKIGISEYDLAHYLCREFKVELREEKEYLTHFKSFAEDTGDGTFIVKGRDSIPYKNGFDTESKKYQFLREDEVSKYIRSIETDTAGDMYLITPKSPYSLNSQFHREERIYLHSELGFKEGDSLHVNSSSGSIMLTVKYNDDLRKDCALIYSGTLGVNNLTSSEHSYGAKSAIYQENRITLQEIK